MKRAAIGIVALLATAGLLCRALGLGPKLEDYIGAAASAPPRKVELLLWWVGRKHIDDFPRGGLTALINAVQNNPDPAVALMLMHDGANPLLAVDGDWCPLAAALSNDRIDLASAFVEHASLASLPDHGTSLFNYSRSLAARDLLLAHGASIASQDAATIRTWYFDTARNGTTAQMKSLLAEIGREHLNDTEQGRVSALLVAIDSNPDPAMALLLLDAGVDPAIDDPNYPLIQRASEKGYDDVVRALVAHGAIATSAAHGTRAYDYSTPHTQALLKDLGVPRQLEAPDDRSTAQRLVIAVGKNDLALVSELAAHGAISDAPDHGSAAFDAARSVEMARLLLKLGASADAELVPGATPLLSYCMHSSPGGHDRRAQVRALIDAGADVRATMSPTQETALHFAAYSDADNVRALLDAGADPNARASGTGGETPLHRAAQAHALGAVEALLAHGADANARTDAMETPLYLLLQAHNQYTPNAKDVPAIAQLLLQHGADPNPPKDPASGIVMGVAPLTQAADDPALTRVLLDAKADPNMVNPGDRSALDITENPRVADLLIDAGGGTPSQRQLNRFGISPARLHQLGRIAIGLLPIAGFVVCLLVPLAIVGVQRLRGRPASPAALGALRWAGSLTALFAVVLAALFSNRGDSIGAGWGLVLLLPFLNLAVVIGTIVGAMRAKQ